MAEPTRHPVASHAAPARGLPGSGGLTWSWSFFLLGLVYAIPAVAVIPFHPVAGLGLAVGVMPVAAFNLPGLKRGRRIIPVVGVLSGVSFIVGSLLTHVPVLAVAGLFALAVGASLWARASRTGVLVLALCLPLVGIALSIHDLALGAPLAGLIVAGSLYAWGVAMLWPEHQVPVPPRQPTPTVGETLTYGILLGLTGATAAAIGFWLDLEHVGWVAGSALLVMRPVRDQLVLRSIGRAASVLIGAFAAAGLALLTPPPALTAIAVGLVLASLSATQASRWYVAPGFTSFIVLTLILQGQGERPALRFVERVLETCLGVGIALFFGALIPAAIRLWRARKGAVR